MEDEDLTQKSIAPIFIEQLTPEETDKFFQESKFLGVCNLRLRKFQADFIKTNKRLILLETPTSSGKTLAALGRVLLRTTPARAVFFYPTNELIKDQIVSMSDLIKNFGFEPEIVDPAYISSLKEKEYGTWQSEIMIKLQNNRQNRVVLINIDGDILFSFMDEVIGLETGDIEGHNERNHYTKGRVIYNFLKIISHSGISCIICTNLDFLFMILTNKYSRSKRIWELLIDWNNLVIDEFHLYGGIQFSFLLMMISIYYKSIESRENSWISFLSATPTHLKNLLQESYPEQVEIIKTDLKYTQENENWTKIRYESSVSFIESSNILKNEHLDKLIHRITKFIDSDAFQKYTQKTSVKLLILVNSNVLCENLFRKIQDLINEKKYQNAVYRIHGLIPQKVRTPIKEMQNAVLIGTRAIDIGIDFDVPFLIFESNERSSFFQRLGRGGRHNNCQFISIVPPSLKDKIDVDQEHGRFILTFEYLNEICEKTLKDEDLFYNFIFSKFGNLLTLIFLQSLANKGQICFNEDVEFLYNVISSVIKYKINENTLLAITPFNKLNIIAPCGNYKGYRFKEHPPIVKKIAYRIAFRGNLLNLPAYLKLYSNWKLIPIHEIPKFNFDVVSYANLKKRLSPDQYAHISWDLSDSSDIILVHSILDEINPLFLSCTEFVTLNECFFTNMNCKLIFHGNYEASFLNKLNQMIKLLEPLPFIKTDEPLDWKIKYFRDVNRKISQYVIGEDAFLVHSLLNE